MNDRYLYRAKRINNGEWVEGFLVTRSYPDTGEVFEAHIIVDAYEQYGVMNFGMTPVLISPVDGDCCFRVDKNTICQCAGLKNFYEKDIVKRTDIHPVGVPSIGIIEYDIENTAFVIHWIDKQNYSPMYPWKEKIEVVGNIFDNPELLETI